MQLSPWKERNGGSKSIETILELPLRKAGALGSLRVRIFQECFGSWRGLLWPLSLGPVTWFLLTSQRKLCKYLKFFWGIQTGRFLITTNNETFLKKYRWNQCIHGVFIWVKDMQEWYLKDKKRKILHFFNICFAFKDYLTFCHEISLNCDIIICL